MKKLIDCKRGVRIRNRSIMFKCIQICLLLSLLQAYGCSQTVLLKNLTSNLTSDVIPQRRCVYAPGLVPGTQEDVSKCCAKYFRYHATYWYNNNRYLTSLLKTLKQWNCTQFEKQCKKRSFSFTVFDELIYDKYCDAVKLIAKCGKEIFPRASYLSLERDLMNNSNTHKYALKRWKNAVISANFTVLDQINAPCVQVAMYDNAQGGYGSYHEITDIAIPFCGFVHCGYAANIVTSEHISTWSCMPIKCRVNNIIAMVVIGILAVFVIVANLTVLYVLAYYRDLRNSQAYYKTSLAVADLLVGLIVFPTFIVSQSKKLLTRHSLGEVESIPGYLANQSVYGLFINSTVDIKVQGTRFHNIISSSYLAFVGFFTTVSLVVSIYTLMAASFDRLWVVYRPLSFDKEKAKKNAKYCSVLLWCLAVLFASLPYFVPGMHYGLITSVFVSFTGSEAMILYIIAFLIPLVTVWFTTVATYAMSRSQARNRRNLTQQSESAKLRHLEMRLVKTLFIMILAFTLSVLPIVLVIVVSLIHPNVYPDKINYLNSDALTILKSIEYVSVVILMSNSLWNCIVYNLRNKEFNVASRQSYRKLFRSVGLGILVSKQNNIKKSQQSRTTVVSGNTNNSRTRSTNTTST